MFTPRKLDHWSARAQEPRNVSSVKLRGWQMLELEIGFRRVAPGVIGGIRFRPFRVPSYTFLFHE